MKQAMSPLDGTVLCKESQAAIATQYRLKNGEVVGIFATSIAALKAALIQMNPADTREFLVCKCRNVVIAAQTHSSMVDEFNVPWKVVGPVNDFPLATWFELEGEINYLREDQED